VNFGNVAGGTLPLERLRFRPETPGVRWKRITLVGVGLLGGSLGLALKKRGLADSVTGYVRRKPSIQECKQMGAVDDCTLDLEEAVTGADLIILCTPIAQMRALVEQMLPALEPGAVITDVGSVKASVVGDLENPIKNAAAYFVGSHPMAGSEKTGVAAARADLFVNAICVITPTRKSNRGAVRQVERLWRGVGSRLLRLTPEAHDKLVSRSSHLPHVIAAQLANFVLKPDSPEAQALLCANGFRDTTRIASGSPEMWRDIVLANRAKLLGALDSFGRELQRFRRLLKRGDARAVSSFFMEAKRRRDEWAQETSGE
jgi:prephenate dehydrogenase